MALLVNPADIKKNVDDAATMQKKVDKLLDRKERILSEFSRKQKQLLEDEKEMLGVVQVANDRCRYHAILKKEVEMRLAGKRKAELEKDDDRRVKDFINVVEKEDMPKLGKLLTAYDKDLDEIEAALK